MAVITEEDREQRSYIGWNSVLQLFILQKSYLVHIYAFVLVQHLS